MAVGIIILCMLPASKAVGDIGKLVADLFWADPCCCILMLRLLDSARGIRSTDPVLDLSLDWILLSGSQTVAVVWTICSGGEIVAVVDGATTHTTCNSSGSECRDTRGADEASVL